MMMYALVEDGRYEGISLAACFRAHKGWPDGPLPSRREALEAEAAILRSRADDMLKEAQRLIARAQEIAAELAD